MTHQSTFLTPTQLAGHLACVHLTQLDRQRRAGLLAIEFIPDARLEAMRLRGQQHESAFVEQLRGEGRDICDLRGFRDPAATRTAMENGRDVIVQAPLANDSFYGVADVLLRVKTPSALGTYSYEPLDTKLGVETKVGTILQLCTYCELLQSIQELAPEWFHVVTPLGRETYRTADFAAYYRLVRARVQDAMTAMPIPETYPDPVQHCDICGYWQFCDQRRRRDDHPSLIANIRTGQIREFQQQGIATLLEIAQIEGRLPNKPRRGSSDTFLHLGHQARLQAQSRESEVPPVEFLPSEAGRGLARLPEPSIGDVFLDFEGDPFVGVQGLEYLTGYCSQDAKGSVSFTQRWAFDAAQEKAACEEYIDFVMGRLREHAGMHIYHFAAYEPSTLKRLCARHDTRGQDLDRLLRGGRFVDLHAVVRQGLRIGVERYGLKEMEVLHGFARMLDLRDAARARRDLEILVEFGEGEQVPVELRERVAIYNRDDCLSTQSLRDWLEEQRTKSIDRGESIARPERKDTEPTEKVSERDQRIESLQRALTENLPDDPAARSDEQNGRALLSAMLSYFRQEDKNAWWEHFRLLDLPNDDQLEEREMLAGLEFVEVLPRQGRERAARCRFHFPSQDTAIDVDDTVYFTRAEDPSEDDKSTSATVMEFDLAAGSAVLRFSAAAGDRRPTAVFRKQVVGAKVLEEALLDFARFVCEHGFPSRGPFAAASELLLRRLPRRHSEIGGRLRRPDEPILDALKRVCNELDWGVLPVQGPPGSGKTFSGARAILGLARAGRKVGITAVSHKVIDNLLEAVRDAAKEQPDMPPLRLVHKHDEDPPEGIEYTDDAAQALNAVGEGVVGGTAWLWASQPAAQSLDYLFIDEAGQMALAQALAAARSARNIVLLGDPQQLEQPTRGAHAEGADVAALVHVIGKERATLGDEQGLFLDSTYRLHPAICAFTSESYYEGRLKSEQGLERQLIGGKTPFSEAGVFLVEAWHEGNQAQAIEEVETAAAIIRSLLQPGTTWTDSEGRTRALTPRDILVVAPYNAQVGALRRKLADLGVVRVGTVDKFQGQEAPVVIYSCTSSSPEDAPRGMSFLYDPHRFNVATSRARSAVIVIGNSRLFEPNCRTPEQMRWANGFCRYRERAITVRDFG